MSASASLLLANAVLLAHVAVAAFVVVGLVFVVVGSLLGWQLAGNIWLRLAHIAAIAVVVGEAWLGVTCPLTSLEMSLRSKAGDGTYNGSFIEHWLQQLLYYSAPPWVFVLLYSLFFLAVAATWWYFPPRPWRRTHATVA